MVDNIKLNLLLSSGKFILEEEYWSQQLGKRGISTSLIVHENDYLYSEYNMKSFIIKNDEYQKLIKLSKNTDLLLYMVLLSALKILIYKYNGEGYSAIFSPIFCKNPAEVNLNDHIVLMSEINEKMSCRELLMDIYESSVKAYKNQDYPFEKLLEKHGINSINSLTNVGCALKNIHNIEALDKAELPIKFYFEKTESSIECNIAYKKDIYKETVPFIINHFLIIINGIISNINTLIKDIDIISHEESEKILFQFNNTKTNYPHEKSIHKIFEDTVGKYPDKIALVDGERKLTYKELNENANRIANLLREKGFGRNSIILILCERNFYTIVGILGIVKAGCAYLPIDVEYPVERIKYMIKECNCKVVLGTSDLLMACDLDDLKLDKIDIEGIEVKNSTCENPLNINVSSDLINIIYTSGSTGKPKGVMVKQIGVIRLVKGFSYMEIQEKDALLKTCQMSFDPSTHEIFLTLLNGLTLHMVKKEIIMNKEKLKYYIDENKITLMLIPAALFNYYGMESPEVFENLRYLLVGGDILLAKTVNHVKDKCKDLKIVNAYGPTENTVMSTSYSITDKWMENRSIPIGKPISNSSAYILDKYNKLCPVGVIGELAVGGDGVTAGYLGKEALTAESFIANPYMPEHIIYKTGDLARWLPDGNIEFYGRKDNQVKIRGFRVELGEIEKEIIRYHGVKEAVVVDLQDNESNKYLCAYFVGEENSEAEEVKNFIENNLPEYMVPAFFIKLEKLPLTENGKVDRKQLPRPEEIKSEEKYEAPENIIEERIAIIFQQVLGRDKVGTKDNFFRIGGQSLKALNLVTKINAVFSINLEVSEIFHYPTVKELSSVIMNKQKIRIAPIEKVTEKDFYETSSAQKRMFMTNQVEGDSIKYNMPAAVIIEGALDKRKLNNAFNTLIERHESLRTSFYLINERVMQKVHHGVKSQMEFVKLDCTIDEKEKIQEKIKSFITPFKLDSAPLIRGVCIELNDEKQVLFIDCHHIVCDGVSMKILIDEFSKAYNGDKLEEIKLHYKDFAAWQNNLLASDSIKNQENYWTNIYENEVNPLNLPIDYTRPDIQDCEGKTLNFNIDKTIINNIKDLEVSTGTTLFMIFLAAFNIILSKYSGEEDIVVGVPIAGRNHADLENIVGMFVNTLALRNYPVKEKSFLNFLYEVKNRSLEAFENQDYQFEMLINKLDIKRDMSRNPLFDVMLIVQNVEAGMINLNGAKTHIFDIERTISKFDMSFFAEPRNNELYCSIEYRTKLFKEETIKKFKEKFIGLLDIITKIPEIKISDIILLSEDEADTLNRRHNKNIINSELPESASDLLDADFDF